ncbi:conserved protein of unknown function [Candidatus Promineifilum breve]|uniref:DUF5615 domain-containing protein n=1 Tax=Candidatus Promineifilum breve TaxID=1806508 RepID=A0A160T887_9CHLR|nr:DUF5615 family PIN-like protein [Candidatus Promineifilum breve]CUS05608.1 conserved protein of unknown function [Candidatus Promineifilum breve]
MAAFYANENFPRPSVETLRSLGHDVLTIQETGRAGAAVPDEEVLAFAAAEGRILLTLNRKHFIRLHERGSSHAGIVVCTFDADFTALARRIHESVSAQTDCGGLLLRVNRSA